MTSRLNYVDQSPKKAVYLADTTVTANSIALPSTAIERSELDMVVKGNTVDGEHSQPKTITSVGKNLFDKVSDIDNAIVVAGEWGSRVTEEGRECVAFVGKLAYNSLPFYTKFLPDTRYTLQVTCKNSGTRGQSWGFKYTDGTSTFLTAETSTFASYTLVSTINKSVESIIFAQAGSGTNYYDLNTIQLERGTSATTYEAYKTTTATTPVVLRSVPAIADSFNVQSGVNTQNVTLDSSVADTDYDTYVTTYTNVDVVKTTAFSSAVAGTTGADSFTNVYNSTGALLSEVTQANIDLTASVGKYYYHTDKTVWFILAKAAYGTKQIETATCTTGAVTTSGNITVTVTANGMGGTPKDVVVAVTELDDVNDVAGKVRTALTNDSDVSAFFVVSGADANVVLTTINTAANDATMAIVVVDTDSTGVVFSASVDTQAGVAGIAPARVGLGTTQIIYKLATALTTTYTPQILQARKSGTVYITDTSTAGTIATLTYSYGKTVKAQIDDNSSQIVMLDDKISKWQSYTPTFTWGTADPETNVASSGRYHKIGNTCHVNVYYTADDGNDSNSLTISLPIAPANNSAKIAVSGYQKVNATWTQLVGYIDDSASTIQFLNFQTCTDGTAVEIILTGFYEVN